MTRYQIIYVFVLVSLSSIKVIVTIQVQWEGL